MFKEEQSEPPSVVSREGRLSKLLLCPQGRDDELPSTMSKGREVTPPSNVAGSTISDTS